LDCGVAGFSSIDSGWQSSAESNSSLARHGVRSRSRAVCRPSVYGDLATRPPPAPAAMRQSAHSHDQHMWSAGAA
jgi:hypothetical protein